MDDPVDKRSSGGSGAAWLLGIIGALVLYALSPAPVAKVLVSIYGNNPPSGVIEPFYFVYAPIFKAEHFGPVRRFYQWYFGLWSL